MEEEKPESLRQITRQNADTLKRIETVLVGDQYDKEGGLIGKVDKHGKYIKKDEKVKWMFGGGVLLLGALSKFGHHLLKMF